MRNVIENEVQEKKNTKKNVVVVAAKQANHYSFILPKELWGFNEKSLYKCVAQWGLLKNEYICCDDIAPAFGISARQATNILSMIHRRYSDTIKCKIRRFKSGGSNVIKTHILVTDICSNERKRVKNKETTKSSADVELNLKNLFLQRKMGSRVSF